MIKILLIIFLLFLLLYILQDIFFFYRKLNISKILIQNSEKFERQNPNASMKIVIFGDSTAVGTGASNKNFSIAGLLGQKFPDSQILNFGVVGAKLKDVLEKQIAKYQNENAEGKNDLILIQVGANDITHFTSLESMEKNLKEIIEESKKILNPGGQIVILHSGNVGNSPIFPFYISPIITHQTRKVREMYMKVIAGENNSIKINYVDLFQERKDEIFLTDIKKYFAPDYFHPTDEGYKYWFEKICEKI